jgi:Met-zincin
MADVTDRYINHWNIQKADPKLDMSPPKKPLVWYVESTTPIKYRRWVRDGILMWNKAFEEIGIVGALEVYQQDANTGAHMDKDPEDARYNFFRWNVSNQGYAIGPSRTNPLTGEILDADVVWHQGLTRSVRFMLESLTDDMTEETFSPETLAFFDDNPDWDPRVRMAQPARREQIKKQRALDIKLAAELDLSSPDHPWTNGLNNPTNTACRIGNMLAMDLSLTDSALAAGLMDTKGGSTLDGLPEEFLGPMIRYISAHEVGHTIGLQHNMASSTIRDLKEVNSEDFEGPTIGSVMDYVAPNINHGLGEVQGPYATPMVGPYDEWAIAYGYGPEKELEDILARSSEPDLIYISQIETAVGSDPRNQTWDYGSDNLAFAESRMDLVNELRGKIVDDLVKDGESWAVARRRYQQLVGTHAQMLFVASRWIGGTFTSNAVKGEPDSTTPIFDVPAARQRQALKFIMDNAFEDDALGLTPELIRHFGKEYYWDPSGINELAADPNFTVHDFVGAIQGLSLTLLMNPTTLRHVYDNEFRAEGDDVFTLPELIKTVTDRIWNAGGGSKQDISSFRRNLQREHVGRLIDLSVMDSTSPSLRAISTLATEELRRVDGMASRAQQDRNNDYVKAHLNDIRTRISKALEATYVLRP